MLADSVKREEFGKTREFVEVSQCFDEFRVMVFRLCLMVCLESDHSFEDECMVFQGLRRQPVHHDPVAFVGRRTIRCGTRGGSDSALRSVHASGRGILKFLGHEILLPGLRECYRILTSRILQADALIRMCVEMLFKSTLPAGKWVTR